MRELGLGDFSAYETHLNEHPDEWGHLDGLCRVTISRFYRDRGVFDFLGETVLPGLARDAGDRGVRCWSAGCASGEEPYTLALVWQLAVSRPGVPFSVVATDSDDHLLARAGAAIYPESSLKDLPENWKSEVFAQEGEAFVLEERFRSPVLFQRCDLREEMPDGPFDLILCRNLVFTYFEEALQREVLARMTARLREGGALIIGTHERLPTGELGLTPWNNTAATPRECTRAAMISRRTP
jgi:chemotaxis protein methyltransferase CheR